MLNVRERTFIEPKPHATGAGNTHLHRLSLRIRMANGIIMIILRIIIMMILRILKIKLNSTITESTMCWVKGTHYLQKVTRNVVWNVGEPPEPSHQQPCPLCCIRHMQPVLHARLILWCKMTHAQKWKKKRKEIHPVEVQMLQWWGSVMHCIGWFEQWTSEVASPQRSSSRLWKCVSSSRTSQSPKKLPVTKESGLSNH